MLSGSCHCGAVEIVLKRKPRSMTQCTCSLCRRYAALWAYCTAKTARVGFAPGAVTAYLWNDRVIRFMHCNTCGCLTHYESVGQTADGRLAVNARMLGPADLHGIPVRIFDGAHSWERLGPEHDLYYSQRHASPVGPRRR